jgi:ribA/ribD-fused uncharacterized protein
MDIKEKIYDVSKCIVLHKVKEPFGDLLNMSSAFPMTVNGVKIRSSEALYQSLRFPFLPDVQQKIIDTPSPLMAKRIISPLKFQSRIDWDELRIDFMRWCLRVKLACNYDGVGTLLDASGSEILVEKSPSGTFWGCSLTGNEYVGMNCLGELLMELRDEWRKKKREEMVAVEPLVVSDFLLLGSQIQIVRN